MRLEQNLNEMKRIFQIKKITELNSKMENLNNIVLKFNSNNLTKTVDKSTSYEIFSALIKTNKFAKSFSDV